MLQKESKVKKAGETTAKNRRFGKKKTVVRWTINLQALKFETGRMLKKKNPCSKVADAACFLCSASWWQMKEENYKAEKQTP